ncbi:MAG: DHA2 family efflux MFS transporter permease subunit [Yaniella sp.]|nr:DHA2 family efflux MFS transporter permease subunit [Yaniella sp.]MDN5731007.1 DHA2 family efflux MFS transporter permease subunit [Yaniella sp.]MDN5742977.1 DHA2 family efflux MFS transporter permease subunit [Yaniella sp.]MDN5816498.1 DHA2 family efflux MFS transporter permease subunit [Yaniella sp.]MDN5816989.1 DHA2 family efflux MFS transporter permease subunit [Yaniella sp.]
MNRNVVLAVLVSGAFVVILNQTLMNTALPALMEDFGITANSAQWVTTMFMLVNGIMIPVTAFLIQKFTTRSLFFAAMGLFTIGTVLAMLAPTYAVLLAGRFVQAAGGGIIMPLMQTILFAIFPIDKRGQAMGTFGLVISFAPAIGPTLSGWIVEHFPWQTLFMMMLPIAIIDMIIAYFILDNVTERTNPRLDSLSIVLSSLAFGGMLFGFGNAGNTGWISYGVLVPLSIGLVTLGLFIWRQLTLQEPMLELRILKNPMFTLNTLLGMAVFIAMIGGMLMLPVYMQTMAGYTATESGMMLLPGAAIMGIMSPVTGRIFDRFGAKWLAITGFALLAVGTLFFTTLTPTTSFAYLTIFNAVRMFGTAMVIMPVTTAALNELPQRLIPHGSALNNTMRQVAASVGTAVLVTVMTGAALDPATHGAEGLTHGVNTAFIVAGSVAVVGFIGAFFIRGSRPVPQEKTASEAPEETTPES